MPIPGSADDGTMTANLAQFDLANEMAEFEHAISHIPSGVRTRTLFKKTDFRVVLISMEAAAMIKEHHADGTTSVQVLKRRHPLQDAGTDVRICTLAVSLPLGASIKHDVEAIEESAFLLTISWPDNQELLAIPHRGYGT